MIFGKNSWHDQKVYKHHPGFLKTVDSLKLFVLPKKSEKKQQRKCHSAWDTFFFPPQTPWGPLFVVDKQQGFAIIVQDHGCSLALGFLVEKNKNKKYQKGSSCERVEFPAKTAMLSIFFWGERCVSENMTARCSPPNLRRSSLVTN